LIDDDVMAYQAARRQRLVQHHAKVLTEWPQPLGFELMKPQIDEWGQAIYGRWGGWLLGINEMIFNERLVLWNEAEGGTHAPNVPVYGWCYPKGNRAILALATFFPETMGEPLGYAKRALGERAAGERAADGGIP
jgi:hypothetical protein